MPQEFLTQNELTQIYTTLLIDKSLDNQKLAISSLQKIYGSKVEHNVPLLGYANNTLDTLFQESFHNQKLSRLDITSIDGVPVIVVGWFATIASAVDPELALLRVFILLLVLVFGRLDVSI